MKVIENQVYDAERALYNLTDATVRKCSFAGPADGESALKEARRVRVEECDFSLRYPLWHNEDFAVVGCRLRETSRAPLWYSRGGRVERCSVTSVKAVRECEDLSLVGCDITSPEFGWRCRGVTVRDSRLEGEYAFFESSRLDVRGLQFKGKYSFQYVDGLEIADSRLDTKDAFWHAKNVTVRDCLVRGEYLAWFAENITFENCRIIGTQPSCYRKGLKLVNCEMVDCDLSFEYSDVEADVKGGIDSVKNPRSGHITADSIGEIITADSIMENTCRIEIRKK